ncbi:unnamed protein product, partial [Porites lobata]
KHGFYNSKKQFWQLSKSARNEKRQKIKKLAIQSVLALDEFKPVEIKFDVQGQEVIIPLSEEDSSEELEPTSSETTKRVLVAKDIGLISDEAYHELRMSLPEDQRFALPPFSAVKQERNKQNEIVNIKSIPEAKNGDGARRSIKEVLEQLLTILRVKKAVQSNGKMISLRFAADGRRTSNKIGTVKAEFSLIEEKENDCDHQYCVVLCNRNEDYKEAKACLGPILDQIDNLHVNGAEVDGVHYSVILQDWPIERTIDACRRQHIGKRLDQRRGSVHEPLQPIQFERVIIETLHLFLRIMGLLFHQVIIFLFLEKQLEDIGVPFKFFETAVLLLINSTTHILGKDLRNILYNLDLKPVFEGIVKERTLTYKKCEKGFDELVTALEAEPGQECYKPPDLFREQARKWAMFFRVVHFDEDITPYIHALAYHVPQFLEGCGSISIFNCQPVEKKNHEQSRMFHRATQKGGRNSHYTRQVMEKENRKIFARVNDLYRTKRMYQKKDNDEGRDESAGSIRMYDINDIEEG